MKSTLSTALSILLSATSGFAQTEAAAEFSLSGKDLSQWKQPTGEWRIVESVGLDPKNDKHFTLFEFAPGQPVAPNSPGTLINNPKGGTVNLIAATEHGDVEAHVEFNVPKGSNSGVYFQGRYEVQILDSFGVKEPKSSDCGGIYERWKDDRGYEGHPPRTNGSKAPGEWQTFDVIFQAPRFDPSGNKVANARFVKVAHNGVVIHENVEVTGPTRAATFDDEKSTGPLMLQGDHGPVAFRNIQLRPYRK